jgi:hypothetical protein
MDVISGCYKRPVSISVSVVWIFLLTGCGWMKDYRDEPELESLKEGLKTSVAISYCASVATAVLTGEDLPDNVSVDKHTGLIYIKIDESHPLPFNDNTGDIVLACIWNGNGGVMSVLFGDFALLDGNIKLYGLYTVPIIKDEVSGKITTVFATEDIIIGTGSDTILDLSNVTLPVFNAELTRLDATRPSDIYAAIKQNVWFVDTDMNNTPDDVYDDYISVTGGGQIAEAKGSSGGVIYHALIDAVVNYSICNMNPLSGNALTQNFKVGGVPYIDLGNAYLSFHNSCDGKAHVELSTGKYLWYTNKDIDLDIW